MPSILEQKLFLLPASSFVFGFGAGGFKFIPCDLADARPFAFRPPLGSFPSALCQAGDLAILFGPRDIKRVWLFGDIA